MLLLLLAHSSNSSHYVLLVSTLSGAYGDIYMIGTHCFLQWKVVWNAQLAAIKYSVDVLFNIKEQTCKSIACQKKKALPAAGHPFITMNMNNNNFFKAFTDSFMIHFVCVAVFFWDLEMGIRIPSSHLFIVRPWSTHPILIYRMQYVLE